MNDKPGGTPSPFSFAPAAGPNPAPSQNSISPSNFGARPAPSGSKPHRPEQTPSMANNSATDNIFSTSSGVNAINSVANSGANPNMNSGMNPGANPNTPSISPNATNPLGRPMEKVAQAPVPPKKTKKTGLIIGIASAVGVLLIGAIIAVIAISFNQADPVQAAIDKLLSGQGSPNVQVKGDIKLTSTDDSQPFGNCNFALDSKLAIASLVNDTSVIATCDGVAKKTDPVTLEVDELYPGNGDLYLRVDGIGNMLGSLMGTNTEEEIECEEDDEECLAALEEEYNESYITTETNCLDAPDITNCEEAIVECDEGDEECLAETEPSLDGTFDLFGGSANNMFLSLFAMIFDSIDGEWIKIPAVTEEDETAVDPSVIMGTAGNTDCTSAFIDSLRNNTNTIARFYREHPFVLSSNENIPVAPKNFPVYQITIDRDEYNAFIASMKDANIFSGYDACMSGGKTSSSSLNETLVDQLSALPDHLPVLYVEVNGSHDFTRVYWTSAIDNGNTITADLGLSYPADVSVSEPQGALEINEIFQNLFGTMYDIGEGEETVIEGEVVE